MTIVTVILLIACGGAAFFFWKNQQKSKLGTPEGGSGFKPYGGDELRIENVGPGGVLHLRGVGPDMEDFDLKVVAKHSYGQGGHRWYELECDKGTGKAWVEMEEDDELELSIGLVKLKLADIGVSKKELANMDDDEKGSITYNGRRFNYEDSESAVFYKYGDENNGEQFYFWDFESDDEEKFISVEKWDDGSFDVSYSEAIKPSQVTIYSLK